MAAYGFSPTSTDLAYCDPSSAAALKSETASSSRPSFLWMEALCTRARQPVLPLAPLRP